MTQKQAPDAAPATGRAKQRASALILAIAFVVGFACALALTWFLVSGPYGWIILAAMTVLAVFFFRAASGALATVIYDGESPNGPA